MRFMNVKVENQKLFGTDTGEKLPEVYLYSHKAWDGYMGHLWFTLLQFIGLSPGDTVVEIAPGASTKIAMALSELRFKGKLYIVDPATDVLIKTKKLYAELLPDATVIFIEKKLNDGLCDLPHSPACILSNHCL